MPTRLTDPLPQRDPLGYERNNIDYMPHRLPRNYPRGYCACTACVMHFASSYGLGTGVYDATFYRQSDSSRQQRYTGTIDQYVGMAFPEGFRHPRRPSRWSQYEMETPLSNVFDALINHPLRFLLKRSGRAWSAEVECNDISVSEAANVLGVSQSRYSTSPDRATIVASPDGTVDAEIKISCMRDGSDVHATMARNAYAALATGGASCHVNAGHHVHVDGTRLSDLGVETTEDVMRAVWRTASVCRAALLPLAGSGYSKQRGASTSWEESHMLTSRQAIHGSRLYRAASSRTDSNATIEYRLPNATLSPIRAQSFIAIPLGILDFAERALLDEDEKAAHFYQQITDHHEHANRFDELTATSFLIDALRLSKDSRKAMAIAAHTSPSVAVKCRKLWEERADGLGVDLDTLVRNEEARVSRSAPKAKSSKQSAPRVRDQQGRFASMSPPAIWQQLIDESQAALANQQGVVLDATEFDEDPDYEPEYEEDSPY